MYYIKVKSKCLNITRKYGTLQKSLKQLYQIILTANINNVINKFAEFKFTNVSKVFSKHANAWVTLLAIYIHTNCIKLLHFIQVKHFHTIL